PAANASVARAVPFDEKVETSDSIILGKCTRTQSQWDGERRWIVTYSTFAIEKALKGVPVAELTVVTPGGSVDGIRQESIGIPAFREGDENVIFVRNTAAGPTVSFASQGAYDVVHEGNERIVQPVPSQSVVIDTQRGVAVAPEEPRPLGQFETEVRQSIRRTSFNRMEMTRERRKQQASFWPVVSDNKGLIALALVGIGLATWQLRRR
ncbi:MAG TPA: hypothetical protein VN181_13950, partial [Thermoanaerobaculia bacterium]|nr:hypothetical protein [Thermoanaerobaculia bacterium]